MQEEEKALTRVRTSNYTRNKDQPVSPFRYSVHVPRFS